MLSTMIPLATIITRIAVTIGITGIARIVITYLDVADSEYWDTLFIIEKEETLSREKS